MNILTKLMIVMYEGVRILCAFLLAESGDQAVCKGLLVILVDFTAHTFDKMHKLILYYLLIFKGLIFFISWQCKIEVGAVLQLRFNLNH